LSANKKYNPEEPKYPLEYKKYLKVRETNVHTLIEQKRNCFGNFGISLFWEEKIIILIRFLQLYSLAYIAFYEYWPYNYVQALEDIIVGVGFNFIYLRAGYYRFIEKFQIYAYNIIGWLIVCGVVTALGVTVIGWKKLRHEFKHSKTLLKKWVFNLAELLYTPILMNLIPMLICEHRTIKNGYDPHNCGKYGARYYFYILGIVAIAVGVLYNIGLIYMVRKRKISYREKDHDKFVRRKEIEYVLEISDSWRKQSFFIFSSFKGSKLRLYFKPVFNMFILFLICVHAFCQDSMYTKAMIYSVSFSVAAAFMIAVRPYRCTSSNFLLFFSFIHICGPMYMVTQVIKGMKHGLLVNTYFSICLYVMFAVFGACQLVVVIFCFVFKAKWPMNTKFMEDVIAGHERILEMMQQAFTVITKLRLKKVDTNRASLEEIVEDLTDEYNKAFGEEHPFQYTVLELIDELKDTAVVIDDRKKKQEYHFLADFLEIIDDKKSYL
jgi:hypothetical protein